MLFAYDFVGHHLGWSQLSTFSGGLTRVTHVAAVLERCD